MGYAFFNKSDTFRPSDYNLGAGDTIEVVCVGGGQGGSARYYDQTIGKDRYWYGGNGGTTSFGNYLSASGGSNVTNPEKIRGNNYFVGGTVLNAELRGSGSSKQYYNIAGGGGAGGYVPGEPIWGGDGTPGCGMVTQSNEWYSYPIIAPTAFGGFGSMLIRSQDFNFGMHKFSKYTGVTQILNGIKGTCGLCCGGGAGRAGEPNNLSSSSGPAGYAGGGGGTGYGAGGGGGSWTGGAAGLVRRATIKLNSSSAIPVAISGGGEGAGYMADGIAGGAGFAGGSTGHTGSSTNQGGGAGGYAGVGGKDSTDYSSSLHSISGGGGAGGCVEIFW